MAMSDYDADATELLETYGTPSSVRLSPPEGRHRANSSRPDFLMKYIVIGQQPASPSLSLSTNLYNQVKPGQANHASYIISHTTPVRTTGRRRNTLRFTQSQSRNMLNIPSGWSSQVGQ